jgi:trigger factor
MVQPEGNELDGEVDALLDWLRHCKGTLIEVDRHPEIGDFVSIDFSATVDDPEIEVATATDLGYEIGDGELIEGIDKPLLALRAGASTTFTTKLVAGEYGGRDAKVMVTLNAVMARVPPELNDEFAGLVSGLETLDDLKAELRERLMIAKQQGLPKYAVLDPYLAPRTS